MFRCGREKKVTGDKIVEKMKCQRFKRKISICKAIKGEKTNKSGTSFFS